MVRTARFFIKPCRIWWSLRTSRDGSHELLLCKLFKHLNLWYRERDVVLLRFLCYQQSWCTSILFCYCERWWQFWSYVSVELVLKSPHLHHQMFILLSQHLYLFYQQLFNRSALKFFSRAQIPSFGFLIGLLGSKSVKSQTHRKEGHEMACE